MARKRKLLVPEAREALDRVMIDVLKQPSAHRPQSEGQATAKATPGMPAAVKASDAQGSMVERLVQLAKEQLNRQR
ncbi:MAG: hypothetical protein JWN30_759 [Bacilli bacterium]|nr:hypothetical protein [Bacilli bacterium]